MKKEEFLTSVGRAFELLGNPLRMRIFLHILKSGCDCDIATQEGETGNCISGIVKDLSLPQSTVSTYIKDLADGGLVECKKRGKFCYCRPNRETLVALKTFVDSAIKQVKYTA